jgi:hypothetical protein
VLWGTSHIKRGKTSKKFDNVKYFCGACKSRFFEPGFFMLFDAILTAVFKKIAFQLMENYSRDLFRAFFAQKVVFGKVTSLLEMVMEI